MNGNLVLRAGSAAARELTMLDLGGFQRPAAGLREIQRGSELRADRFSANRRGGRLVGHRSIRPPLPVVVAAQSPRRLPMPMP